MSQKELRKHDIIQRVIRKEMIGKDAARLLGLSIRQIWRMKSNVHEYGGPGLVHGSRGKRSNRALSDEEKDEIAEILRANYPDFKPTHATEKLKEIHAIARDPKTIRVIMIDEGLWTPRSKRKGKKAEHRSWRKPRDFYGELVQFDGSYHLWLEDRLVDEEGLPQKLCLLLAVDDATSKLIWGRFDMHEGVFPVFGFWKEYVSKMGKPVAIYLDKFSTYSMNKKFLKENHDLRTQFQRAAEQLCIDLITAHSPEAKGRVENKFKTLQDRLVKEMRLRGISTIEEANKYFQEEFIPWFNAKYGKEAIKKGNLHRALGRQERVRLASTFSRQTERTVQNDYTVSFDKQWYQILPTRGVAICKRDKVIVEEHLDSTMNLRRKGTYKYVEIMPISKNTQQPAEIFPWILTINTAPVSLTYMQKIKQKA